jgi:hypothetical protein
LPLVADLVQIRRADAAEQDLDLHIVPGKIATDADKIRELASRGEAWSDSESRQMLEHAIQTGRGGVYLRLTPHLYAKLRQP